MKEQLGENLQDYLAQKDYDSYEMPVEEIELDDEAKMKFAALSPSQANFYVKEYAKLKEQEEAIEELAKEELAKCKMNIEGWKNEELSKLSKSMIFFKSLLEEYTKRELADKRKRSVSLPCGTLSLKKAQNSYQYNEPVLLEYLAGTEYLEEKVVSTLNKNLLKKSVTEIEGKIYLEGIELEGLEIIHNPEKFEIKPAKRE